MTYLDRKLKPIILKPALKNGPFSSGLVLNCLNNDIYKTTMGNGLVGEIEISPNSMEKLRIMI